MCTLMLEDAQERRAMIHYKLSFLFVVYLTLVCGQMLSFPLKISPDMLYNNKTTNLYLFK